jgi:hypothetical protein
MGGIVLGAGLMMPTILFCTKQVHCRLLFERKAGHFTMLSLMVLFITKRQKIKA